MECNHWIYVPQNDVDTPYWMDEELAPASRISGMPMTSNEVTIPELGIDIVTVTVDIDSIKTLTITAVTSDFGDETFVSKVVVPKSDDFGFAF